VQSLNAPGAGLSWPQFLVLAFFAFAWVSVAILLLAAPELATDVLHLPSGAPLPAVAFLVGLTVFRVVLSIGVLRRWRWIFWLILLAFLAGILRVPAGASQLTGLLPAEAPTWYVLFQLVLGLVQFGLGLVMLIAYRRHPERPW
jgi:hypothetical protein